MADDIIARLRNWAANRAPTGAQDDVVAKLGKPVKACWNCVERWCTKDVSCDCDCSAPCDCDCHDWDSIHAAAKAEIERLRAERDAARALADQLASALRSVVHDRPTAHSDAVWNQCLEALEAHQEARRG